MNEVKLYNTIQYNAPSKQTSSIPSRLLASRTSQMWHCWLSGRVNRKQALMKKKKKRRNYNKLSALFLVSGLAWREAIVEAVLVSLGARWACAWGGGGWQVRASPTHNVYAFSTQNLCGKGKTILFVVWKYWAKREKPWMLNNERKVFKVVCLRISPFS